MPPLCEALIWHVWHCVFLSPFPHLIERVATDLPVFNTIIVIISIRIISFDRVQCIYPYFISRYTLSIKSVWNSTAVSAAILPMCPSNSRTMDDFQTQYRIFDAWSSSIGLIKTGTAFICAWWTSLSTRVICFITLRPQQSDLHF